MIVEHAQIKYHNDAMICTQQVNDSYKNPAENIDYNLNMQTRYDKNIQILIRIIPCCSYFYKTRDCPRTHRDNLDNPFVRHSNCIAILKGFPNMDDTLKYHLENGLKLQKCAQRKFSMKLLLAFQNLVERKLKILWKKRNIFL